MPSDKQDRSPSPYSRRASSHHHRRREEEHAHSRSPRRRPNRSRSPAEGHHYRSRSPKPRSPPAAKEPPEETRPKKKIASGFKFKEKKSGDSHDEPEGGRGLERGYRERDTERRPQPTTQTDDRITEKFGAGASVKDKFGDVKVAEKFGNGAAALGGDEPEKEGKKEKKKKDKTKAPKMQTSTEMITVFVNDRLGTRTQVPCLGSDTVGDFKKYVAANIGRRPHEIMLKRQGERPFRDQLTLEDYGVSNGVQLDLELDTGD